MVDFSKFGHLSSVLFLKQIKKQKTQNYLIYSSNIFFRRSKHQLYYQLNHFFSSINIENEIDLVTLP